MENKLLAYSGITTKAKALHGKLMTKTNYEELLQMTTVREFVLYLKGKEAYHNCFDSLNEENVHRGQIEGLLKKSLYHDYESLYRFADPKQREKLSLRYLHYEVTLLGDLLKKLYSDSVSVAYKDFLEALNTHVTIPVEQLLEAKTLPEFIDLLKGTQYEKTFKVFEGEESPTLFELMMHLNLYYFKTIWKKKDKVFTGSEKDAFTASFGTKIDGMNIIMVYRCKKYYDVDYAKIAAIVIPFHYRLKGNELMAMMQAGSITEFKEILSKTNYRINKDEITQEDMERNFYLRVTKAFKESECNNPLSMAPIFNYLYQKEREINNLITIVEGIRYGWMSDKIAGSLII